MESTTITDIINKITEEVLNPLIYLLFAAATVLFIWGVIQYILGSQGDENALHKGKQVIFYGIIGMFIMASAWGIVRVLCNFLLEGGSC